MQSDGFCRGLLRLGGEARPRRKAVLHRLWTGRGEGHSLLRRVSENYFPTNNSNLINKFRFLKGIPRRSGPLRDPGAQEARGSRRGQAPCQRGLRALQEGSDQDEAELLVPGRVPAEAPQGGVEQPRRQMRREKSRNLHSKNLFFETLDLSSRY